jgi:DNA-nicking Smr family endonuclease
MPIDASLDLHGMTAREAEAALASFFAAAERTGCRKVMIVHGKGLHSASGPVLEGIMKRWLERRASAGKSGHADAANGGKGATWVLLKRKGNQRSR